MIEALIGLGGVIVGSMITISKDVWIARLDRRRHGIFAAIQIIGVLDQFVETCVDVVCDDGRFQGQYAGRTNSGEEYPVAQVECPKDIVFPEDIDWKSLGSDLMYEVLALPPKLRQANRNIDFWAREASWPFADEFFETRQENYADLGLQAIEAAKHLRRNFKIPERHAPSWNPDWNSEIFLREKVAKFEAQRRQTTERLAQAVDGAAPKCPNLES